MRLGHRPRQYALAADRIGPEPVACAARWPPARLRQDPATTRAPASAATGADDWKTPRSGDVGRVRLQCGANEGLTVPRLTGYPRRDSPTAVRGLPSATTRWTPTRRSWSIARYPAGCVTSGNTPARRRTNVDSPCISAGFLTFGRADLLDPSCYGRSVRELRIAPVCRFAPVSAA